MPSLQVYLVDVKVQGEGAAKEIAAGIQLLNESNLVDVIIVGRGGGSLEDLWAFNEEEVVRAIFASTIPIISSVGHETDVTLSDFVADVRAPTPTAAAEMVCPKRDDLIARIDELSLRLSEFERWLRPKEQRVDELEIRLSRFIERKVSDAKQRVQHGQSLLRLLVPERQFAVSKEKILSFELRLQRGIANQLANKTTRIQAIAEKLETLNPLKVLQRGFAVVQDKKTGAVIFDGATLTAGDQIETRFARGSFVTSTVVKT